MPKEKSVKDLGKGLPQSEAVRMVLDTYVLNVPDVSGISLTAENVVSAADDGKASWQVGDAIVWVDGTEVRKGKAAVADSMKPDVATHTMVVQRMVPAKPGFVTFIARIAGDPGLGIGLTEDNRISELAEKRPGRNDGRLEVHCAARSRRCSCRLAAARAAAATPASAATAATAATATTAAAAAATAAAHLKRSI